MFLRVFIEGCQAGEICAEAENGAQAVAKAAEVKPGLVILDLEMPVMNGLQGAQGRGDYEQSRPILFCAGTPP